MKKIFAVSYLLFTLGVFVAPLAVSAAIMPNIWPSGYWAQNGLVSCTGLGPSDSTHQSSGGTDQKACQDLCDLVQTFENILSFAQTIALFIVTPILFAWGGIVILTAGANPSQIAQGKKIFTGTIVGVLITLGAYLIVYNVVYFLGAAHIGGFSSGSTSICGL